jgi:protein SCO1/2
MKNSGFFWLLGLIILVVFGGSLLLLEPYKLKGSEISSQVAAPSFNLQSSQGDRYVLDQHRGKYVILFFGYTYCPDICPTTLYMLKEVKQQLGKKADRLEVVFITVDPERDSQEKLATYLGVFDKSFYGLTGSESELETVWSDYGVYRQKSEPVGSNAYLVDHSTRLYLIDQKGNLRLTYPVDVLVSDLVSDIKYLVKSEG